MLGEDDNLYHVETFVMQKCLVFDHDEVRLYHSETNIDLERQNTSIDSQLFAKESKEGAIDLATDDCASSVVAVTPAKRKSSSSNKSQSKTKVLKKTLSASPSNVTCDTVTAEEDTTVNEEAQKVMNSFKVVSYPSAIDNTGGLDGWHCEGSIFRILFGIFMWDILYLDKPNVFLTPYQDGPLDFPYSSFYSSRLVLFLSDL